MTRKPVTKHDEDEIVRLSREGLGPIEISERLGRSVSVVHRVRREHGLSRQYKRNGSKPAKKARRPVKPARKTKARAEPDHVEDEVNEIARVIIAFRALGPAARAYVAARIQEEA